MDSDLRQILFCYGARGMGLLLGPLTQSLKYQPPWQAKIAGKDPLMHCNGGLKLSSQKFKMIVSRICFVLIIFKSIEKGSTILRSFA